MKKLSFIAVLVICASNFVFAQQGKVFETRALKSNILKMDRRYAIYLPAGYDESDRSYPVLYLLHGAGDDHTGWVQFGQVQNIADRVIAEGLAGPMIIVMPDANTGVRGYFNAIQGNFNYEDFFFQELIPHIEKTYRVRSERRYRAISGLSMGGGGTIFYALHQPDMFAAAAPLSASTGNWELEQFKQRMSANNGLDGLSEKQVEDYFNRLNIEALIKNASADELKKIKSIRWYISCGDDDFLYEGNSMMHITFRKNEIPHEYRVKDGGHTWTYWRMELPLVMEFVAKSFMQH
jgi:enterochelin esterase-like enzyme